MKEQIAKIREDAIQKIKDVKDLQTLNEIRVKFLGKKGELTAVLRGMGALSAEERPKIGALVNEVRDELENKIQEFEKALKEKAIEEKLKEEKIDITLPSTKIIRGSKHPMNRII